MQEVTQGKVCVVFDSTLPCSEISPIVCRVLHFFHRNSGRSGLTEGSTSLSPSEWHLDSMFLRAVPAHSIVHISFLITLNGSSINILLYHQGMRRIFRSAWAYTVRMRSSYLGRPYDEIPKSRYAFPSNPGYVLFLTRNV